MLNNSKTHIATCLLIVVSFFGFSQVKIGDNPSIIDTNSVLELESDNKVLVITRLNNLQMNTITPLPGAMVYNTEENCIFYYNGVDWVNLCTPDAGDQQTLSFDNSTNILSLTNGGQVDLSGLIDDADNDNTNEIQSLTLVGSTLTLTNGTAPDTVIDLSTIAGLNGLSAYEIWLNAGNTGTEADFLASLVGADGTDGADGLSAYDIWLNAGNTGTEADFLTAMAGADGLSAYQIWLNAGNTGTEADFLASLVGADGANGADGLSAYQIWLNAGNTGTEADFLASLVGADGVGGVSQAGTNVTITGSGTVADPYVINATDNQTAAQVAYDNTTSGLLATDVQSAIDEINSATSNVSLVNNNDGTYTFTDAQNNTVTIADTSISTLVNNGDGTYTYTNEAGVPTTIAVQVNNGLSQIADGTVQLGGALVTPTVITTDNTNTLAIQGLEDTTLDVTNNVVVADNTTGELKKVSASNLVQQEQIVVIATDGQTQFNPPLTVTNGSKIDVYRNGVRIDFTVVNTTTIELEPEATCFAGDEIRIVQLN